jgi:hypothetical protein
MKLMSRYLAWSVCVSDILYLNVGGDRMKQVVFSVRYVAHCSVM